MSTRQPLSERSANTTSFLKAKTLTKRGPKPKPIAQRHYTPKSAITRTTILYSTRKKIDCLMMKRHHKIPIRHGYSGAITGYRAPTNKEVGIHFGGLGRPIPPSTIQGWSDKEAIILRTGHTQRRYTSVYSCQFPALELALFESFKAERATGKAIRRSWFLRKAREIWIAQNPTNPDLFCPSITWFRRFCHRAGIGLRVATHEVITSNSYI